MDFGLFTTWNAVYVGDKVPWDPEYRGGQLLEAAVREQAPALGVRHVDDGGGRVEDRLELAARAIELGVLLAQRFAQSEETRVRAKYAERHLER